VNPRPAPYSAPALGKTLRQVQFKALKNFRSRGFWGLMQVAVRKLISEIRSLSAIQHRLDRESDQFDRDYGVVTAPPVPLDELENFEYASYASPYQAIPPLALGAMLEKLPIDPADYSFIDMGSGMGRALLLAAAYPFREILGVEFSARLHQQACHNIENARAAGRIGHNVASVNLDASRYAFPDGNLVVYLFNPFQEPIIQIMLDNLQRALDQQPRNVFIIYCHPQYPHPFDTSPFLRKILHSPSSPGEFAYSVYEASLT
jgi:hypothetical protein